MGTFSVRKTTEQFIAEAKAVHGDKYDYSKTQYLTNREKVLVTCPIHGDFLQYPKDHLNGRGCKKCYQCSKHKFGVAICDIPNCTTHAYYNTWRAMLGRTIGNNAAHNICEEWLTLSNFKEWFENPKNGYQEGYHLDKDIIVRGNKKYSPSTCCFVPKEINTVFAIKKRIGCLPSGIRKSGSKFVAQFWDGTKRVYLGTHNSIEDAFNAYKIAKEQHIKELAESYFKEGKITERVYQALMKYEVEITD